MRSDDFSFSLIVKIIIFQSYESLKSSIISESKS